MSLRFCPRGNSGRRVGNTLVPTRTRPRIKKTLSKELRSHSSWRGFTMPACTAAVLGMGQDFFGSSLIPFDQLEFLVTSPVYGREITGYFVSAFGATRDTDSQSSMWLRKTHDDAGRQQ